MPSGHRRSAEQALRQRAAGPGSGTFQCARLSLDSTGGTVARYKAFLVKWTMHFRHLYSCSPLLVAVAFRVSLCLQRLEVGSSCSRRCAGKADDRRPCRSEDVVVLQPVCRRVCCHTKTKTFTRPALRTRRR